MTILNHRDYRLAKTRRAQLGRATSSQAIVEGITDPLPADLSAARIEALRVELKKITADIETYERLRASSPNSLETIEADELGLLPILGRIARQLSQKELGELLGMKEQQVQRYERDRYATISLEGYQRILSALEVEVHPRLSPKRVQPSNRTTDFNITLSPELLRDLRKRGWVDLPRSMAPSEMVASIGLYVKGSQKFAQTNALHRRTLGASQTDGALKLWTARVLTVAAERRGRIKGKFNIAETGWLQSLIQLSMYPDGPRRAADMLREHGIILVIEPHLPQTLLDGAAFLLSGGIPVIALTIRHDRIDNFWFTLLHELGHVFMHFNRGLEDGFLDDDLDDARVSEIEREADDFARTRLIPDEIWANSVARFTRSKDTIEKFSRSLSLHPAIVAGRVRKERDYRLFTDLVGTGQVRTLFAGYVP
jgi:HTH-type transcriptional regulator/antitoxin HigA